MPPSRSDPSDLPARSPDGVPPAPGRREQRATRLVFFIAGFCMAAWAPMVPFAKARAGLDDGGLGLLLLCLGGGSLVAMPMAGVVAARWGCRRPIVAAALTLCATLPLLATVAGTSALAVSLFVFGAAMGLLDCTVNIQAVIVERASGRTLMSGFHGLFSVGGIAGAAGVSALLGYGLSPWVAAACVVALTLPALAVAHAGLLIYGSPRSGPAIAWPRGIVLFIGLLCFVCFLAEGTVLDWSAVFLTEVRGMPVARGGLGYVAFAAAMTVCRLTGDAVVRRLGARRVVVAGGLCAAAGLAVATLVPAWPAALVGYALVGVGCANIVPVMYSLVGRQRVMPEVAAVPAISTLGYAGILLGPALVGGIAHASSLSMALLFVGLLMVGVALSVRWLRMDR